MDTLAIVVSYNDRMNTMKTVGSLTLQARIVVWDNGSTDGTVETLKKAGYTVEACPDNLLWTPALNRAIDKYLTDETSILVSNNDIIYQPDTVQRLKAVLGDPAVGIVAPIGSGLGALQDFASHHGAKADASSWPTYAHRLPTIQVAYVVGASMLIPTQVWKEVGPFDNTMPLGADDHDYCIRVKAAGYKIMLCQSAYVSHKSHASFPRAQSVWDEWGGKSWKAFNEKWAGYYLTEEEALKCHWAAEHHEGWDVGTGWMTIEERKPIWDARFAPHQSADPT